MPTSSAGGASHLAGNGRKIVLGGWHGKPLRRDQAPRTVGAVKINPFPHGTERFRSPVDGRQWTSAICRRPDTISTFCDVNVAVPAAVGMVIW